MSIKETKVDEVIAKVVISVCISLVFGFCPLQAYGQNEEDVQTFVTVMDRKNVADNFGSRIAKRYIGIQVTVQNTNEKFKYLIHDISLDLNEVFLDPEELPTEADNRLKRVRTTGKPELRTPGTRDTKRMYRLSSLEHSLLRGVAEKGQGQDKRNFALRVLRGVGTVAAGMIGVATLGPSYAPAVAMFNGPTLTAFADALPDYTINQLNRLNDSAYRSNTLVSKQEGRVMVVFIPQSVFLTEEQRKMFEKSPRALADIGIDFRRAKAIPHGSFILELKDQPPSLTTALINSTDMKNFQNDKPVAKGRVIGKYLADADIKLANPAPAGISVERDGTPVDNQLNFIIRSDKPVPPDTTLNLEVSNSRGIQNTSVTVSYQAVKPTITDISPPEFTQNTSEAETIVAISGTNFVPGATDVTISGSKVRKVAVDVKSATLLEATLRIDPNPAPGARQVRVVTGGGMSDAATFTIVAPSVGN